MWRVKQGSVAEAGWWRVSVGLGRPLEMRRVGGAHSACPRSCRLAFVPREWRQVSGQPGNEHPQNGRTGQAQRV